MMVTGSEDPEPEPIGDGDGETEKYGVFWTYHAFYCFAKADLW